jgi:membrane protease YdiL (CAAX protease family)
VGTLEQAGRGPASERPGFRWRVLSPIGAVLLAFAVLIVAAGVLQAAPLSDTATTALLQFGTSLLLLVFALLLRRRLPAHERRLTTALKGSLGGAIGMGVALGVAVVVGAGVIILIGQAIDPVVNRRLEDMQDIGTVPWQLAITVFSLVVLAPLGEELLFRGLLLRALVRRLRFWPSAIITSLVFASAHPDSYVLWPRAIALALTGLALAWLYRRRGYWASVTAHATVNIVAAIALVTTSVTS